MAYGAIIKIPSMIKRIPIIKKTVLFDAIKSGQYLNSNKIQLIINLGNARV